MSILNVWKTYRHMYGLSATYNGEPWAVCVGDISRLRIVSKTGTYSEFQVTVCVVSPSKRVYGDAEIISSLYYTYCEHGIQEPRQSHEHDLGCCF